MRVVSCGDAVAWCEGRNGGQRLNVLLVGAQPPGAWVLAFQGSAVRVLSDEEALRTNAALDALDAALSGATDVDAYFDDLVAREPELPAHLKGGAS
jgi:hydrogenase expression/formation protein HypC